MEAVEGKLVLKIPLAVGGQELIGCTSGIGRVEGEFLLIEILPWMAEKLGVSEGSIMAVDNLTGEFRIQAAPEDKPNPPMQPTPR